MNAEAVLQWLAERPDIRSLRGAICDLNGALRGKRLPVSQASKMLEGKLRMPLSAASVDIWGEDIVGSSLVFESGDADGICTWTGRDCLAIDWLSQPTALLPLWLSDESGAAFLVDPRRALAQVLGRYRAAGLIPVVATELEFYLVDPTNRLPLAPRAPLSGRRLDSDGILSIDEIDEFESFVDEVYTACAAHGIPVDAAIAEGGAGQFEINLKHLPDPLKAADDVLYFKRIVKGVARKLGMAATFMAKPYGDRAGSGMHVHFSVIDAEGVNVFDDGSDQGSALLQHSVGGVLEALRESTLVFAPHYNSYRRLRPGTHAPAAVAWGYENRTTAVRIPGGPASARRIEHRVAGADTNPYLVLASILGAALDGIERTVNPPDPVVGDAYRQTLTPLPSEWGSAIRAFETGLINTRVYAPLMQQMLGACKRQELTRFAGQVSDFEFQSYRDAV